MNLFKIALITTLFVSTFSYSQDNDIEVVRSKGVNITKSDPYEVVDSYDKNYFPINENEVLAIKMQGKKRNEFVFQKFEGERLNLTHTSTETFEISGFNFEYFVQLKNKMYIFYSVYDKPNKTEQLFAQEINTEEGSLTGSPVKIVTVNKKLSSSYYLRYSAQGKFRLDISDNKEIFAIKYSYTPEIKNNAKNKEKIGMQVFDQNLEQLWEGTYTMPKYENMMDVVDFTVDSKGNGYFLVKNYREEQNRKNANDPDNEYYEILISDGQSDLQAVEFNFGDKLVKSAALKENKKGDIICAGYYRESKSYSADGAFLTILKSNGEFETPQFYEFPLSIINQYAKISEKKQEKMKEKDEDGKLGFNNLHMRTISTLDDGGVLITGEVYYVTTTTDSKGNVYYTYHYNDILTTKINADGELGWMQKLPKRSTFESYKVVTSPKYTYVLFSDNPHNAELENNQAPHATLAKERQVISYQINNESGEKKYLILFGFKEIDGTPVYQYNQDRIIVLSDNSFAVELYIKGKQDMMFKVDFDE